MTTPSPSPPISLSPPSAGERLARCMALPAYSSPLLPSSGCPTQIQTLRITSTQALFDAVTAVLPLLPLPPSLYIPPPVDRRDDIPESEGRGIDYGFVNMVDAEERRQGIRDIGSCISQQVDMDSQWDDLLMRDRMTLQETATHQDLQTHRDHVYAHETHLQAHQTQLQLQSTLIQTQHQDQMVETLRVIRDMRREMSDMQAELLALREQQRRARQPGPEARIPDHQDASGDAD
ncbi:hypothetical protein Tco_1117133, partial [Tanacetum coccineum]